jgi:predicted phage tail protein
MASVITYHNPLDPLSRKTQRIDAVMVSDLLATLDYDPAVYDLVVSRNDEIVDGDFLIGDSDVISIVLVPAFGGGGVKNVLRVVAMIAVAVVAPQLALGAMWTIGSNSAILYAGITAGIMLTGASLINAVLPPQIPDISTSDYGGLATSNTYSWDPASNLYQQGISLPKLFGTYYVTPPIIAKYIETIDDKQYLHILYGVNDGVIESIDNVTIGDNDLNSYAGVSFQYTLGNTDQALIADWAETRYTKSVNQKIAAGSWRTVQTDGDSVRAITVCLVFPRGLFYADDNGNIQSYSVKVQLEYSNDGVSWNKIINTVETTTSAQYETYWEYNSDSGHYVEYYQDGSVTGNSAFELPAAAQRIGMDDGGFGYYVERWAVVTMYTESHTLPYVMISNASTATFRKTYSLTNLAPDQYYVRATLYEASTVDSRHGSDCYFEYLEEAISDDFTYPNTALFSLRALATDQLSGAMPTVKMRVTQGTKNPADIVLAILSECGVDSSQIDTARFDEWRTFCTANAYTCSIYFDQMSNVRKAIDTVATLGRARVEQFGSMFSVIIDKPDELPVQGFMFGMGNILKDSFKEEFLPIQDRANVIEVTYYDEDNSNAKTIVEVSSENYDSERDENRVALNLIGCTNRNQAIRQANYQLNCNRYLTNTATWDADIDSLVCRFGDVVQVSHDVPAWGESGRLVSATTLGCVLDRRVAMVSGKTYYIRIKYGADNLIVEKQVINSASTTDTLSFSTALTTAPAQYDICSFGEVDKVAKLMRIVKIGTSGTDLRRTISAIEYNDGIYADSGKVIPSYVSNLEISQLRAYDYIRYANDKSIETVLYITWSGASISYMVQYKRTEWTDYRSSTTYDNAVSIVADPGEYEIIVSDLVGNRVTLSYSVLGKLAPPDPVTGLVITQGSETVTVSWIYDNPPIDLDHFEISFSDTGSWVTHGTASSGARTYELPIMSGGLNGVQICAVDTSGVKSTPVSTQYTPTINPVTGMTSYYSEGWTWLCWDRYDASRNGIRYELRRGDLWENGSVYVVTAENRQIADGTGRYMVRAVYTTRYGVDIYSDSDDALTIDVGRMPANVVAQFDDSSEGWPGTLDTKSYVAADGSLTLGAAIDLDDVTDIDALTDFNMPGGVASYGRYVCGHTITLSSSQLCNCTVDIDFSGLNDRDEVDLWEDLDSVENFDGYVSGDCDVIPMISTYDGATWTAYRRFYPGAYAAIAFRFALGMYSTDLGIRPIVTRAAYLVDMPDRILSGTAIAVPTSGLTVTYPDPFQVTPSLQITIIDSQPGDDFIFTVAPSSSGFSGVVKNAGVVVARSINYLSKGY